MRLADPHWLLLLPIIGLVAWRAWRRPPGRLRYGSVAWVRDLATADWPRRALSALRLLALVGLTAALARPQMGRTTTEVVSRGIDIFLALDTSGSMEARDLHLDGRRVNRLEVVRRLAADFIRRREGDRVGLVVFGEHAFVQCPLTLEHDQVLELLEEVRIGMAGDATAVGDAMGIAVNHMKDLEAKSRVMILLTDGASNAGLLTPAKAAEAARAFGVKVYTVGVGIPGEAPFLVKTPFGEKVFYRKSDLDEPSLKAVAETTGARFYRAQDARTLEAIYAEIDRLEKSEARVRRRAEYEERYHPLLWLALGLLGLELALGHTLLGRVP